MVIGTKKAYDAIENIEKQISLKDAIFGVLFEDYMEYDDAERATEEIIKAIGSIPNNRT